MSALTVTLPFPPSTNNLFRNAGKRRIKTPLYACWSDEAEVLVAIQRKGAHVAGPYGMTIRIGRPDKRKRDLSNTIKAVEDALVAGGAVDDDSLCQKIDVAWEAGLEGVRVLVLSTEERT